MSEFDQAIEYLSDLLNDLKHYNKKNERAMCLVTLYRINCYSNIILEGKKPAIYDKKTMQKIIDVINDLTDKIASYKKPAVDDIQIYRNIKEDHWIIRVMTPVGEHLVFLVWQHKEHIFIQLIADSWKALKDIKAKKCVTIKKQGD